MYLLDNVASLIIIKTKIDKRQAAILKLEFGKGPFL